MTEKECKEYDRGRCYACALYESWNEGKYGTDETCYGVFDPFDNRGGGCSGWFDEDIWQREWGAYPSIKNLETGQVLTREEYIKIQSSGGKANVD